MSRTYKIQRAYHAHKKDWDELITGPWHEVNDTFRDVGQRWGDQRKMRAKLKVSKRRIERKKNNRTVDKIDGEYQERAIAPFPYKYHIMLINEVVKEKDSYAVQNARAKGQKDFSTDKKVIKFIREQCSTMLAAYLATNKYLYRGLKSVTADYAIAKIRPDRRPIQMDTKNHEFLKAAFDALGLKANRTNSIFCSAEQMTAADWTGNYSSPHVIFVRNGWTGLVFEQFKESYAFYDMSSVANKYARTDDVVAAANEIKSFGPKEFNTSEGLAEVLKTNYNDILITGTDYLAIRENRFEHYIWPILNGEAD